MLVLLERPTPTERAVYVLREAFAYGHREIAEALDLTEANCRQLYRRAVARIGERGRVPALARAAGGAGRGSFLTAARDGDLAGLESCSPRTWSGGATAGGEGHQRRGARSRAARRSSASCWAGSRSSRPAGTSPSPRSTAPARWSPGSATRSWLSCPSKCATGPSRRCRSW
ncbi:hypothetical protein LV779_11760 [Streptomyces thinghirensis]|nr:hypothetical protein [Streptomyces thinghirensis]